jgi:hypothetical protein
MKTLYEFKKFPVSVCTQEGPLSSTEELISAKIVEDSTGLLTFLPYVEPERIYLSQHNSSVGKTWQEHNDQFAQFVHNSEKKSVVDIGGGSGNIYKSYVKYNKDVKWKIIDLNPTLEDENVDTIKGLYTPEHIQEGETVITSHFLEHLIDLKGFLEELRNRNPKYHIFTLPNFKKYAQANYSATLMFEHPHYLTEEYLSYILPLTGWKIVEKKYYNDHSIFFLTEPTEPVKIQATFNDSQDIISFVEYMQSRVDSIKHLNNIYVFGAHFTYYYLLNLGIKEDQIVAVIDNDPKKQGRRMYGTNTKVIGGQDVPQGANVFVEMGPYNKEIKAGLTNVNFI